MKSLDGKYAIKSSKLDFGSHSDALLHFQDASLYQTGAYALDNWGTKKCQIAVLENNNSVEACAIVRIEKVPLLNNGIAYARWAPLWKRNGTTNLNVLQNMLRGLYNEYAVKQKMIVRLLPRMYKDDPQRDDLFRIFNEEGFRFSKAQNRTMVILLEKSLADLRAGLDKKWRYSLNQAEKNDIKVAIRNDDKFDESLQIFTAMHSRKKFHTEISIEKFMALQKKLQHGEKLFQLICYKDDAPISFVLWSEIGSEAVVLFAGTTEKALENNSGHLGWWKAVEHCRQNGLKSIDLGGVDKERNPGVYHFKKGLCGKNGREVELLGIFEGYQGIANGLLSSMLKAIKQAAAVKARMYERLFMRKVRH